MVTFRELLAAHCRKSKVLVLLRLERCQITNRKLLLQFSGVDIVVTFLWSDHAPFTGRLAQRCGPARH